MKKLIPLVLALCMACMLIPAMADEDITGEWYGAMMGQPITMTFNADGTVGMFISGEQISSGTWALEGTTVTITDEDDTTVMELQDGNLVYAEADVTMSRDPANLPAAIELAPVKAAASAEEFYGVWTCKYVENEGVVFDPTAVGTGETFPSLKLAEGTVEFVGASEDDAMAVMYNLLSLTASFADGKLTLTSALSPDTTCIAEMLEDGMLKFTMVGEGGLSVYFVPAA